MKKKATQLLFILFILFILILISKAIKDEEEHKVDFYSINGFDNKYDFFGNHEKFANYLLYQIHDNITILINHLNKKYKNLDNKRIREGMFRLSNSYHINKLVENIPTIFSDDTSYTVNKGETIAICLRHKNAKNKFHDMNLITFVTVHELAHVFSISYGHDDEFWENFKFLLSEAIECKIYNNINYIEKPIEYCGMIVKYNPIFDENIAFII